MNPTEVQFVAYLDSLFAINDRQLSMVKKCAKCHVGDVETGKLCNRCRAESSLREIWSTSYRRKRISASFDEVFELYQHDPRCHYCRKHLEPDEVSLDHKTPLSSNVHFDTAYKKSIDNIAICCVDCNYLKHTKSESEFRRFLAEYRSRLNQICL